MSCQSFPGNEGRSEVVFCIDGWFGRAGGTLGSDYCAAEGGSNLKYRLKVGPQGERWTYGMGWGFALDDGEPTTSCCGILM